jgi:hypothetical protein
MLSAGNITTETLVWHEGMTDWEQIGKVPEFSGPVPEDISPLVVNSVPEEPSIAASSADTTAPPEPSDAVTIKESDSHTIQFSKSRNVLLISSNDYHAGPLVLTKLDLLGFLTTMETSTSKD